MNNLNGKFVETMVIFPDDVLVCKQYVLLRHLARLCSENAEHVALLDAILDGKTPLEAIGKRVSQEMISNADIIKMASSSALPVDQRSILSKMVVSLSDSTAPLGHIVMVVNSDMEYICEANLKFYDHVDKVKTDDILDKVTSKPNELVNFLVSRPKDLGIAENLCTVLRTRGYKPYITMVDDFRYNKGMSSTEAINKTNLW